MLGCRQSFRSQSSLGLAHAAQGRYLEAVCVAPPWPARCAVSKNSQGMRSLCPASGPVFGNAPHKRPEKLCQDYVLNYVKSRGGAHNKLSPELVRLLYEYFDASVVEMPDARGVAMLG